MPERIDQVKTSTWEGKCNAGPIREAVGKGQDTRVAPGTPGRQLTVASLAATDCTGGFAQPAKVNRGARPLPQRMTVTAITPTRVTIPTVRTLLDSRNAFSLGMRARMGMPSYSR